MKTIIINERQARLLKENFEAMNEEVTFFAFLSHTKAYIKKLLTDPINAQPDAFLIANNLNGEKLLTHLLNNGIIERDEKIRSNEDKDEFVIKYKVPRQNFERKMKRLFSQIFEKNVTENIEEEILTEDGEGAMGGDGGATSANACNASAPVTKLFGTLIRKTKNEAVEMNTAFGDFGYDASPLAGRKDPAYDHNNMIQKSVKDGKRKRIRKS